MLREALNEVVIEGILNEVDLTKGSYNKNGIPTEYIRGKVMILVEQNIEDKIVETEIPVEVFQNKYKNNGDPNGSYESWERVLNEMTSVAACGNRETADKVRVTRARIDVNEFIGRDGQLVMTPRVSAPFISKVTGNFTPKANFQLEGVIKSVKRAVDVDGVEVEPAKLEVELIVPGYKERLNIFSVVVNEPSYINAIETYWEVNKAYRMNGYLDFHAESRTIASKSGFGKGVSDQRTVYVREFVVDGGDSDPILDGFDIEDLQRAAVQHKAHIEELKNKPRTTATAAPAKQSLDLGF